MSILKSGWIELVVALLLGAPVRLRSGRVLHIPYPKKIFSVLTPSLFGFDFSKWQGVINFSKVLAYGAKFIILRCAYAATRDEMFLEYINECLTYFPNSTSAYHYYDPVVSPTVQANKVIEILAPYKGRIKRVWGDFEFYWSGAYEGSAHWKVFAERIIAAGYEFGVYTRKTWWDSRVGNLALWFGQFPLWAAQYASSLTLIPAGWTKADIWQSGTPSIGIQVGVSSLEVDYDIMDDVFYQKEFGGTTPTSGGTVRYIEGTSKGTVNIRKAPAGDAYVPPRYLFFGDKIKASEVYNDRWLKLYEINGQPAEGWSSAGVNQDYILWTWVEIVEPPPPDPEPTLPDLPFRFEIGDDILYIKQVISGILKPK